jgi:hypothetical protein
MLPIELRAGDAVSALGLGSVSALARLPALDPTALRTGGSMITRRSVSIVLGLALAVTVAGVVAALTPEEQAALRAEAINLNEQARGLEQSADISREQAAVALFLEFRKSDGVEDQGDFKRITALQKWIQLGDAKQMKASDLRESARALLIDAFQTRLLAFLADTRAENERARAGWQRDAAAALLAAGADAGAIAAATALNKEAERTTRMPRATRRKQIGCATARSGRISASKR